MAWLTVALLCLGQACVPQSDRVATRWLRASCGSGETADSDVELRAAGDSAADALRRAYSGGSGHLADEAAIEAGKHYDQVIDALDHGRTYGLSTSEVDAIRRETKPVHVRRARDDFEDSYRSAALTGLAVIGRPRDLTMLRGIALDTSSDYRDAAASALEYAGIPVTPP